MTTWTYGIGHLAIVVSCLEKAKWFFAEVLELPCEKFREDQIIVHLQTSILVAKLPSAVSLNAPNGSSSLAVSEVENQFRSGLQVLDHYGFQAPTKELVDEFYKRVVSFGLVIEKQPYDRSDGRAFYFRDPFGNLVEYLWYVGASHDV